MKRILVIDESEVIRETLALILGREFSVVKKFLGTSGFSLADTSADVDLLIIGVSPALRSEAGKLLRFAAQVSCAVLFLVESRSAIKLIEEQETVGCLAKPFNPYELKQKVGMLLARTAVVPSMRPMRAIPSNPVHSHYLRYPFLDRTAAALVQRFAKTHLPVLISGEIGCGQERVARGICALAGTDVACSFVNAADINDEFLASKMVQLSWRTEKSGRIFVVEEIEKLSASAQSKLLNFIEEAEATSVECRFLATTKIDLLERVYQGEFLEGLYYRIATLILKLRPLRDRRNDIPMIAAWFAQYFAPLLELSQVTVSPEARDLLANYLWFGNLSEMETVIARTLAVRRKTTIEAHDLVFDSFGASESQEFADVEEFSSPEEKRNNLTVISSWNAGRQDPASQGGQTACSERASELKVLIHELAHEMKNPMVTIKTFAQLLDDRYEDEDFRARFRDVVSCDIERMDDLLEMMIEFADFSQPRVDRASLDERLRWAVDEVGKECGKRQAAIRLQSSRIATAILADENQLDYILKNVLSAVVSQARLGSEIGVEIQRAGTVVISYFREGPRMASITQYLGSLSEAAGESILPLRILLAKQLVERNGGEMAVDSTDAEKEIVTMEFPIA
jgi:DNA-binding NtrC family response regulator